jgi:hypothetical protein
MAMRPSCSLVSVSADGPADRAGGWFWPWANTTAAGIVAASTAGTTYLERRIFIVCISFEVALGIVIFKSKTLAARAPVGPAG